jgi:hypothetical protein
VSSPLALPKLEELTQLLDAVFKEAAAGVEEVIAENLRLRDALSWYEDVAQAAAKDPPCLPSQDVAFGMLQHDAGRRAREALGGGAVGSSLPISEARGANGPGKPA